MTIWAGGEPYTLQLPLMLDDYPERGSVERAMRVLNRLVKGDDDSPPGVVELGGIPLPVDEWVIDGIDYGDPIRAVDDLRLLRQPVTLTLREYVPPEYMQLRRRSLVKPRRKTKVVTVKKGDTPAKIARRFQVQVDGAPRAQPEDRPQGRPEGEAENRQGRQVQGRRQDSRARSSRSRRRARAVAAARAPRPGRQGRLVARRPAAARETDHPRSRR